MNKLVLALVGAITLLAMASAFGDEPSKAQPESKWCLQQAVDESKNLVIITVDLSSKSFSRKADYPWLLQVNISTLHQNRNGHPTNDEAAVLNLLEDRLTGALRGATDIKYIGRATVKGSRELVYFVKSAEKANAVLAQLAKKQQPRKWEYQISKDVQWKRADDLIGDDPDCL
jgi:hypothetical protein